MVHVEEAVVSVGVDDEQVDQEEHWGHVLEHWEQWEHVLECDWMVQCLDQYHQKRLWVVQSLGWYH